MKSKRWVALTVLATPALPTGAAAATEDVQVWSSMTVSGKIVDGVVASAEVVGRLTDEASRPGQFEIRTQIGHPVGKNVTLWLGYVRFLTYSRTGTNAAEEQFVQQVNWTSDRAFGGTLSSRTRLEQRFQRGAADIAWRLRQQVKFAAPLGRAGVNAVVWVEPFISLNRTNAVRPGIDQVRSFVGLAFKLSKHADLEAGYINQYINRPNNDVSNHALSLSLSYKF